MSNYHLTFSMRNMNETFAFKTPDTRHNKTPLTLMPISVAISQGRAIQLSSPGAEALQGAQTLTVASSPTSQPGTTILQCAAQPGDSPQQFYIQGGQVLTLQGRVQVW